MILDRVVTAFVATLTLVACAPTSPIATPSTDPAFARLLAQTVAMEDGLGAGSDQLALMDEIALAGEVTFDQYREARDASIQCWKDAGLQVFDPEVQTLMGLRQYNANVVQDPGMTDDAFNAILDDCVDVHSYLIDYIYMQQPSSVNAWADTKERHRAEILACFESQGADVPADITIDEMETIREELVDAQHDTRGKNPPRDCFDEVGILFGDS